MTNPPQPLEACNSREEIDWANLTPGEIERIVDKGLRHKPGKTPKDYLKHWLWVARQFGFATHDDSFGEFEKEFAIIIKRLVVAERARNDAPLRGALEGLLRHVKANFKDTESVWVKEAEKALHVSGTQMVRDLEFWEGIIWSWLENQGIEREDMNGNLPTGNYEFFPDLQQLAHDLLNAAPIPATAPEATGVEVAWRSVESDPPPHDVPVILLTPKIPGVVTREKDEIEVRPFSYGGLLQPDGTVRGRSYHGYAEYWLPLDILPKPALAAQPTATEAGQ